MKLCKSNVFVNKVFIKDPESSLNVFTYDSAPAGIKSVLVSGTPNILVQNDGDQFHLIPFDFESEKQFNSIVVRTILTACRISNNVTNSIESASRHFIDNGLPMGYVLVSKQLELEDSDFFRGLKKHLPEFIISVAELKENEILLTPIPDFLGVIAIGGDDLDKYAIGLANSVGPMLVELP